jgi:hypothetical protein
MRGPRWSARRFAGARYGGPKSLLCQPGEHGSVRHAVLPRRQGFQYGCEQIGWERNPAAAAALLDCSADAPASVRLVEIAAAEAFLLELADPHAGCVEDEYG